MTKIKYALETIEAMHEAILAAIRYDDSIAGKAARGQVSLLAEGGGVISGDDLDKLYFDWQAKSRKALKMIAADARWIRPNP
jgi:hypothetical protein